MAVIGIVVDNRDNCLASGQYEVAIGYSRRVTEVGGVPILLPHEPDLSGQFMALCDGLLLTGGVDPDTRLFGDALHPSARVMDSRRQAFELSLLDAVRHRPDFPLLGICLGMQLMALHSGGRLFQYLPDTHADAASHDHNRQHDLEFEVESSPILGRDLAQLVRCPVISSHRQAVDHPGMMRVVARAHDAVIEAIDDPARTFYGGVQWHPERGEPSPLNSGVFDRFVRAADGRID